MTEASQTTNSPKDGAVVPVMRRYTFKLYPTPEQRAELERQAHMMGDLWNALLQRQEDNYRLWREMRRADTSGWPERGLEKSRRLWREGVAERSLLSDFDIGNEISWMYAECPEWRDLSTWSGRRVGQAVVRAYKAFIDRAKAGAGAQSGKPRFRKYRDQTWLPHRFAGGCKLVQDTRPGLKRQLHWLLRLKGVPGDIPAMGRFPDVPLEWADADLRLDNGTWWLSVAVGMEPCRSAGRRPMTVRLDLLDAFAEVNGDRIEGWRIGLPTVADDIKADVLRRRMSECPRGSEERREWKRRLARELARQKRVRREALHVWTTTVVEMASSLIVIRPPSVKEDTASGRGTAKEWGAAVETKAAVNRSVLAQAPALAVAMLAYKAKEAGIEYREADAPETLAAGNAAVTSAKAVRQARRVIKQKELAE